MNPWDRHGLELNKTVSLATNALLKLLRANPNATELEIKALMAQLSKTFGKVAATSAYRALWTSREIVNQWDSLPRPHVAAPVTPEQAFKATAWALKGEEPGQVLRGIDCVDKLSGVLERMTRQPARETVYNATVSAGTAWARVPGVKACSFCLMLASRGAVYSSKKAAASTSGKRGPRKEGLKFHDHCSCKIIESYTDADLPQFIHDLEDEWQQATKGVSGEAAKQKAWNEYITETRPTGSTLLPPMQVTPQDLRPTISRENWRHILSGNPIDRSEGGHRFGTGNEGKTEFPQTWSDAKIREAISETLEQPQWSRIRGDRRVLRRVIDNVVVEVSYYPEGNHMELFSAFPKSGNGVVLNMGGKRLRVPLDSTHIEGMQ